VANIPRFRDARRSRTAKPHGRESGFRNFRRDLPWTSGRSRSIMLLVGSTNVYLPPVSL